VRNILSHLIVAKESDRNALSPRQNFQRSLPTRSMVARTMSAWDERWQCRQVPAYMLTIAEVVSNMK